MSNLTWCKKPGSETTCRLVERWFSNDRSMFYNLDQKRGVLIDAGEGDTLLKIKGSGFNGHPVTHEFWSDGPAFPWYDWEGRFSEDVSMGHNDALRGSLSQRQAWTEYEGSKAISRLGYAVVPCSGWGRIDQEGFSHWFTIHDWPRSLQRIDIRNKNQVVWNIALSAETSLNLAESGISSFLSVAKLNGSYMFYDMHMTRLLGPLDTSAVTASMYTLYNLFLYYWYIIALAGLNEEAITPFNPLIKDCLPRDIEEVKQAVVLKYLAKPTRSFPGEIEQALRSTRIGQALMKRYGSIYPYFGRHDGIISL